MSHDAPVLRKIGQIADATGMTIRTLHYYEEVGLIAPTARTDAGHRLYGSEALEQLYRIAFLRQLGLPLDGVRSAIESGGADLRALMTEHLAAVERRLATENRLRSRLMHLIDALETDARAEDAAGDLLDVMEDMTMLQTNIDRRISILVYADIEAAHDYLIRVFGLGPGEIVRDTDGNVVHAEIEAGDGTFWLHMEAPEFDLASPKTLGAATGTMAVMVGDVDAHHAHAVSEGATIRYEPVDQSYGYREYSAVDPEGHLWSFMKPLG